MDAHEPDAPIAAGPTVVLLAGPGDSTDIVANYLSARVPRLEVVVESRPSRLAMARRRASRIGWLKTGGQVLFVTAALPLLRRSGQGRIGSIIATSGLDASPYPSKHLVDTVNSTATVALLRAIGPRLVVVNGTRIISAAVLDSISCPLVNIHAGITPRYRGVHGGYWARAEGRPEDVGTTVHLVDPGIDTGGVLARAPFAVEQADTIATYPYLHLAAGLPLLDAQVQRALAGEALTPLVEETPPGGSRLYLHPTLWEYLWGWYRKGIR